MSRQPMLLDADKLEKWIIVEFEKQFPPGLDAYVDGRQAILNILEQRVNAGAFAPDPHLLKGEDTDGT